MAEFSSVLGSSQRPGSLLSQSSAIPSRLQWAGAERRSGGEPWGSPRDHPSGTLSPREQEGAQPMPEIAAQFW